MLGPELVMTKISYGGNTIVLRGELNITERYLVSRLNLKARPVAFMFPDSSEVPFNEGPNQGILGQDVVLLLDLPLVQHGFRMEEQKNLPMDTFFTATRTTLTYPGTYLASISGLAYTTTFWMKYRVVVNGLCINTEEGAWQPTHCDCWNSTVVQHIVKVVDGPVTIELQYKNTTHTIKSVKNAIITATKLL